MCLPFGVLGVACRAGGAAETVCELGGSSSTSMLCCRISIPCGSQCNQRLIMITLRPPSHHRHGTQPLRTHLVTKYIIIALCGIFNSSMAKRGGGGGTGCSVASRANKFNASCQIGPTITLNMHVSVWLLCSKKTAV